MFSCVCCVVVQRAGDVRLSVRRSHFRDTFFHYAHGWSDPVDMTMAEFIATFNDTDAANHTRYYLGQV